MMAEAKEVTVHPVVGIERDMDIPPGLIIFEIRYFSEMLYITFNAK